MREVLKRKTHRVFGVRDLPQKSERGEYNYLLTIYDPDKLIIKIGTTNNMEKRMYEHLGYYETDIIVCWISPHYSKYTTLRVEDKNKEVFKNHDGWIWIKNDRFIIPDDTQEIIIKVRKEYHIPIVRRPDI